MGFIRPIFNCLFFYLSILAATYLNNPTRKQDKILDGTHQSKNNTHQILIILISGISLGLAVFTKTPAIMFVPLVGYLIYKNNGSLKYLLLWLIPIIAIQPLWPAYALSIGEFDEWKDSIFFQTHREPLPLFDLSGEQGQSSINILFYSVDPIIMGIGFIALIYSAIRKDLFILLWIIPFVIFLYFINHVFFYYLIVIFPVFCIAISKNLG